MTNTLNSPKKQVIIETAAELFREKGFSATSIRDLAARVGLEPSSIYSHIKSKEELLVEICMPFAQYFTDGMHEIFTSDVSPKKKLRELIKLHLNAAYDHPASVTVFNDEWRFLAGHQLSHFLEMRKEYEKKLRDSNNELQLYKNLAALGILAGSFGHETDDAIARILLNIVYPRERLIMEFPDDNDIKASFNDLDNDIQRISCYSDLLMAFLKKNKRSEVKKLSFKNVIETIVKYYKILVKRRWA